MPKSRNRSDGIYREIRERICLMTYPPGTLLRESELADEFDCSRSPIREVIKRLEHEALVASKNGVGTLVTDADYDSLSDVYEMRLKVAELIGMMAPKACEAHHVEQLRDLLSRAEQLNHSGSSQEELARINHELHYWIISLIGNSTLRHLYDLYYFQTTRIWYKMMPEVSTDEVQALKDELSELISAASRDDVIAIGYIKRNYIARIVHLLRQPPIAISTASARGAG